MELNQAVLELWESPRLPNLGLGSPDSSRRQSIAEIANQGIFEGRVVLNQKAAAACRAGVWLFHDFLDDSHSISQDIDTPDGSFWHAIMHRREGDFWNAKFWFRRVGEHPVYDELLAAARPILDSQRANDLLKLSSQTTWDSFAFVDLCESARANSALQMTCRSIAREEWRLLFLHCYRAAIGLVTP